MPLVRFAHSCHIFMTSQTRGNILFTTGTTYYFLSLKEHTERPINVTCDFKRLLMFPL